MKERRGTCEKCGAEVVQFGRGRPKKLCDNCKGIEPEHEPKVPTKQEVAKFAREAKETKAKYKKKKELVREEIFNWAKEEYPDATETYIKPYHNEILLEIWNGKVAQIVKYPYLVDYA